MSDQIRILSVDGGGIRGIIPAMVLRELLPGRRALDAFHIIAGTSTGGIIACALAKPNPLSPQNIIDLYKQHGWDIFNKDTMNRFHTLHDPRYDPTALEGYLNSELGSAYLSEIKDVELLVPSYAIRLPKEDQPGNTCAPMFFRSWQARGLQLDGGTKHEYDFKLASIARATSAAPTYFPPASIVNKAGQVFTMIDGGVFANNPTMCAIVEAYRLYGSTDFLVVSIGTGSEPLRIDASGAVHWGDLQWAAPIISIFEAGNSQTVSVETDEFLRDTHWRLDVSLATPTPQKEIVNPDMDDASLGNITALVHKADELIQAKHAIIQALKTELAKPKATVQPMEQRPQKGMFFAIHERAVSAPSQSPPET
jgi:predicted acylesterase/phospholipase RssA